MPNITYSINETQENIDKIAWILGYKSEYQDWVKIVDVIDSEWINVWTQEVPNMVINKETTVKFVSRLAKERINKEIVQIIKNARRQEVETARKAAEETLEADIISKMGTSTITIS